MNVVLLLLGLYSRHLKANSKSLMSKTQRIENYRGSQNVSSYSAYMVTGVTAVNLDSLLRLQWNYISIWLSENVDRIEIFSLSWTKELFLLHRRRKKYITHFFLMVLLLCTNVSPSVNLIVTLLSAFHLKSILSICSLFHTTFSLLLSSDHFFYLFSDEWGIIN